LVYRLTSLVLNHWSQILLLCLLAWWLPEILSLIP
jgi:hypothetical protein